MVSDVSHTDHIALRCSRWGELYKPPHNDVKLRVNTRRQSRFIEESKKGEGNDLGGAPLKQFRRLQQSSLSNISSHSKRYVV